MQQNAQIQYIADTKTTQALIKKKKSGFSMLAGFIWFNGGPCEQA
jgi:hypothetical protein